MSDTLTVRDHYALAALNGLLARDSLVDYTHSWYYNAKMPNDCRDLAVHVENIVDACMQVREERLKNE